MRWWLKAAMQFGFAHTPGGHRLYRVLQRRFGELHDLEQSTRFDNAILLMRTARKESGGLSGLRVVELGTGWVPAVPLSFMLSGAVVDTFDVSRLAADDYFVRCRDEIGRRLTEFSQAGGVRQFEMRDRWSAIEHAGSFAEAAAILGGSYSAPFDTRRLPHADGEVDLVVSNLVLQCIPRQSLPEVLAETARILKPNGFAVHRIWMGDEYAIGDQHRHPLEYLQFSTGVWNAFFNHSIKHLNRYRHSQFAAMFDAAGFEQTACRKQVDWDAIPLLRHYGVAEEFRQCTWEDLATVAVDVILRKRDGAEVVSSESADDDQKVLQGAY